MVIQHNILAMNAQNQYNKTERKKAKSTEKLSSGFRVNRAADDAAGLAISEKMRRQIRGLDRGAANVMEGIGYVQTADGALEEVTDMLQRMNELAVQSANGTNSDIDREYLDSEFQHLKEETERVFKTTSFNEKLIWVPSDEEMIQIGVEKKPTVQFYSSSKSIDTTNENADYLPYSSLDFEADANGVSVSWKGYDGNTYSTSPIDWDTLEASNYTFNLGDYMSAPLRDSSDNPMFDYRFSFKPNEYATKDQIISAINNTSMTVSSGSYYNIKFEDSTGASKSYPGLNVVFGNSSYGASYVSYKKGDHIFDAADDPFIEAGGPNLISFPNTTDVETARTSTDKWTFKFYMSGIGEVTATSNSKSSYSAPNDKADDDEGFWWNWLGATINGKYNPHYTKNTISRRIDGSLGSVMDALTGSKGSGTPGLLNNTNGGDADFGGTITLMFDAIATTPYSSGSVSGSNPFSFSINISVSNTDTEQSVLDKINAALNENTILDLQTPSGTNEYGYLYNPSSPDKIDVPIFGYPDDTYQDVIIQAGFNLSDQIDIRYECLTLSRLGVSGSDILTVEDSLQSIEDVKGALEVVSSQRSDFGSYQNRLEHAYNANKNTVENTQAAESQIRDTNMATEMVDFSTANIIAQFGTSMMSQANHSSDAVMSLLQ
ncbi:MAG: hypothetical protein K6G75_02420 [Lachnospiraceae bacterium]|nr:hypothetical protein [Lachnospiraceae bacterium]